MHLYAIGDLHLSFGVNKPMDIFDGWEGYEQKLKNNWESLVKDEDTVVLLGDHSWGMNLLQSKDDFAFINDLPGRKILLKGNHDYFWETKAKMERFFADNEFNTLNILHNNSYTFDNRFAICGTRGWNNETNDPQNAKIIAREASRLEMSLEEGVKTGKEPIVFLHYPPVFAQEYCDEIIGVIEKYNVKKVFYGHLHAGGCKAAFNGMLGDTAYRLVSADYLKFMPYKIA